MQKRYAVIGAGAGGLCAAKNLLAEGIDVTVFEIGSHIGGLWVYENDSGLSPAYKSLHINSEAKVSAFGDFPFPPGTGFYPDHAEMARYFRAYADHFGITPRIRFRSRVAMIEPAEGRFALRLEDGATDTFDGVVVATGHQSVPRDPAEMKSYSGEYLHAHGYRTPDRFAGKRVLVIGPGNSGVDIAADICTVTERTVLSARSPVLIMPRMMFGVPNSRTLGKLEKPWVPWSIRVRARALLTRMFHGRMEQWGFRTPKGRTHPISHPTLISHIAWQRIGVKPGIEAVEGQQVRFVDGSAEPFDCIIAATGYRTTFPYLPAALSPLDGQGHRLRLYNRVAHPGLPGLFFIGFFDVSGGSNIRMMDDQAEYIAAAASGRLRLPDQAGMQAAIDADFAWAETQFPDRPRYGLELDPHRYRKLLARDYAANTARKAQPATASRAA
ncbi:MAG: flavin-containing monooxygenase [Janthinobacterium lividum]